MTSPEPAARWWTIRRARSLKPATYTCPLCGRRLHAMSDHLLIAPEDDASRRRHAHTSCVERARAEGRLRSRDEWRCSLGAERGLLARLRGRA